MGGVCCAPGAEDAANNEITGGAASPAARPGVSNTENTMSKAQPPSTPPPAAAAKAKAKAAPAPAPPAPSSSGGGGGGSEVLNFDLVLSNLDQAELLAYGTAFASFGMGAETGSVPLDCAALKQFIETNSACPYGEVDSVLLNFAAKNAELSISQSDFIDILRQHAISESEVIDRFMNLGGGEPVAGEECRTALLLIKMDMGAQAASVREERWDGIFDSVMRNAEPVVSMEAFRDYCFKVARIANVVHVAKV